jgi:uncharacterized membrane protein (DUF4010 family)
LESVEHVWLIDIAYALGIGLFVGLEREHKELSEDRATRETGPAGASKQALDAGADAPGEVESPILGVRTFALVSLLGWVSGFASGLWPWLPVAAMALLGGVLVVQYLQAPGDLGLTTEIAAAVVFLAGMLVNVDRSLAVVLGLATTLLLISKPWIRRIVPRMRRIELTGTLQLLIVLAIVLPLLPAEPMDPWDALPPRKIGLFVVLIAGLGYIGYFLSRILGPRRGAGLTGIVGGLVSSTAVTITMAQEARKSESMLLPGRLAVFLANAIMFARVLVVTAVISREVALRLLMSMGAMGLIMLGGSAWSFWALRSHHGASTEVERPPEHKNPFALVPALKWGLILAAVLLGAYMARRYFGDQGLFVAAAASGLADVDAITLAVSQQSAAGSLAATTATIAITIAVISNTLVKGAWAVVAGGRRFGSAIAAVFGAAVIAGGAVAVLQAL